MKFLTSILSPERPFLFTFSSWLLSGVRKLLDLCELYLLSKLLEGNWAEDKIGCSIEWCFSTHLWLAGPTSCLLMYVVWYLTFLSVISRHCSRWFTCINDSDNILLLLCNSVCLILLSFQLLGTSLYWQQIQIPPGNFWLIYLWNECFRKLDKEVLCAASDNLFSM